MTSQPLYIVLVEEGMECIDTMREVLKEPYRKMVHFEHAHALEQVKSLLETKKIDAVIFDLELPNQALISTLTKLKKTVVRVPIILLAAPEYEEDALATLDFGIQDYLLKGAYTGALLVQTIQKAIKRQVLYYESLNLLDNINEAIVGIDTQGAIKNWNKAAELLFQDTEDEIRGHSFLSIVAEEHLNKARNIMKMVLLGETVSQYELRMQDKHGNKIDSLVNAFPIIGRRGVVQGSVIMAQDFTQYKFAEQHQAIQLRIATVLAELNSIQDVARQILKAMCEILELTVAEFWAYDLQKRAMVLVFRWTNHASSQSFPNKVPDMIYSERTGVVGKIWESTSAYWSDTLIDEPDSIKKNQLMRWGFESALGFPILFEKKILGCVVFYGRDIIKPSRSMFYLLEGIGKQIGTFLVRKRLEKKLVQQAHYDPLTGLPNKFFMEILLKEAIEKAKKTTTRVAFLLIDLDKFKQVNDSLGHYKGDLVLQEVAQRLQHAVRETDMVARISGDEFAVILSGVSNRRVTSGIARKILRAIAPPFLLDNKEFYLTASIGISQYPLDGENIAALLIAADIALYRVKASGKNNYQYASKIYSEQERKKISTETNLHQALKHHEFLLYYQPIVNVQTNILESVEALLRWKNAEGALILPDEFIPLLEQSGLIHSVGDWVLKTACHQMRVWKHKGVDSVSVNVSIHQIHNKFAPYVNKICINSGIEPQHLILEMTESIVMRESDTMKYTLNALNQVGILTSIDDFGTGYSSFSYLETFPFSLLKIDKSFIDKIHTHESANALLKAIVAMAKILNLKTIAEGVETKEQLAFLKEIGCDQYQGYYYSKPVPAEELTRMLLQQGNNQKSGASLK